MENRRFTYFYSLFILLCWLLPYQNLRAQYKQRLNEGWEFLRQDLGGVWEAVRPLTKTGPENVPVWQKISLPHCFNAEDAVDAVPNYYQGAAWYRTQLAINNPYKNGRTILHFEGAGQKTDVYVYTTKVGSHIGGYDEFSIDITDAVAAFQKTEVFTKGFNGKIPIVVRTDNSRDLEMIPSNLSDFTVYGGLYRYLNLIYVPPVSIDKIFATASVNENTASGNLKIKARLYNPLHLANFAITTRLFDATGKLVKQEAGKDLKSDSVIATFTIPKVLRWSPDNPALYKIEVVVEQGENRFTHTENVGFRSFEFKQHGPFFLNGKRLLLRGTHRHEDAAGVGAALTEPAMRTEMMAIKEMGANFIRLGHYQQSNIILNLCDSLGLLVWEEIPWCRGGLGGEVYKEQGRQMLANMIEQHYNHPSIIIWGLGNENDWPGDQPVFDKEAIRAYMKELNTLSHTLDSSRKTAIRRCDFCRDIVDVYSPTIWAGWYRGIFTEYKKMTEDESQKVSHFLHAEWGGDSHAGRHSEKIESLLQQAIKAKNTPLRSDSAFIQFAKETKDNDWSETYICNLFDWHLKEQEGMPSLTGSAFWTFKDFATPLRPENPVPYVNQKGVIERDGSIKESYYVFQSYWSQKPMVHIYGHSWPVRWGADGEEKLVKVYSNCDEAELFVNGRSYGNKKRNITDYPAAGLYWNVLFKKGINKLNVVAKKASIQIEDQLNFIYQTDTWSSPRKFKLDKLKEENGVVTVQVTLLDKDGVLCLDAATTIQFGIAGDGKLIANQGTAGGSSLAQMRNGRASIKVEKRNHCVLSASAEGLPTAFIEL